MDSGTVLNVDGPSNRPQQGRPPKIDLHRQPTLPYSTQVASGTVLKVDALWNHPQRRMPPEPSSTQSTHGTDLSVGGTLG